MPNSTKTQPVIIGDEEFRPAGMAVAPDGTLFVSDWVDRSYPVHGRGRIWRIRGASAADGADSARNGITALDLRPALRKEAARLLPRGEFVWWRDDTHWNGHGHVAAARAIHEALLK